MGTRQLRGQDPLAEWAEPDLWAGTDVWEHVDSKKHSWEVRANSTLAEGGGLERTVGDCWLWKHLC